MSKTDSVRKQTIKDFGNQWEIHDKVDGDYWASLDMFKDYVGPLLDIKEIENKKVAEVGSGSGRVVRWLSQCNPKEIHAVEPSVQGPDVIHRNNPQAKNLTIHNVKGDEFEVGDLDYVFSLGVIHHIKDPLSTLINIKKNLQPNGKFVIWVYGRENNLFYLAFYYSVFQITRRLPDFLLDKISTVLNAVLVPYIFLCKYLPLPMHKYMVDMFGKCGWEKRKYIIFDQLNPAYAKYYKEKELLDILHHAGFKNVKTWHRHNYSWTAICEV